MLQKLDPSSHYLLSKIFVDLINRKLHPIHDAQGFGAFRRRAGFPAFAHALQVVGARRHHGGCRMHLEPLSSDIALFYQERSDFSKGFCAGIMTA